MRRRVQALWMEKDALHFVYDEVGNVNSLALHLTYEGSPVRAILMERTGLFDQVRVRGRETPPWPRSNRAHQPANVYANPNFCDRCTTTTPAGTIRAPGTRLALSSASIAFASPSLPASTPEMKVVAAPHTVN
jgi:hypothetical protein